MLDNFSFIHNTNYAFSDLQKGLNVQLLKVYFLITIVEYNIYDKGRNIRIGFK